MSMIFQNLKASIASASPAGGKLSQNAAAAQGEGVFGEALVYQMSLAGDKIPSPLTGLTALPGISLNSLIFEGKGIEEGSQKTEAAAGFLGEPKAVTEPESELKPDGDEDTVSALLMLLDQMPQLERILEVDPSLLEKLQQWLSQAQSLLTKPPVLEQTLEAAEESAGSSVDDAAQQPLPPLALHKETIRFAVQDALVQMTGLAKDLQGAGVLKQQLHTLTQSLEVMTGLADDGPAARVTSEPGKAQVLSGAVFNQSMKQELQGSQSAMKPTAEVSTQQTSRIPATSAVVSQVTEAHSNDEAAAVKGSVPEEETTLTAGQLALRTAGSAPVKAAAEAVPVGQFAREMTQFTVGKLEFIKHQGFSEARISLYPEHLGQVDIKISMQNGQIVAQFMTHNAEARELLEQQMTQLRSALQGQGLQVEKLEVTQNSQSPSSAFNPQDGKQSGSGQQQPGKRSREKDTASDDAVISAELSEEWKEWNAEIKGVESMDSQGSFTAKA
ncbi:flagellar hook-length control protein FliK [Paenibacillus lemnae]|uniref:Flagellar hook-length control protein FliK n=1 Tax=Paenibacillus lemnae TaxID=1330551 RepID=A0A848M7I9_PAELE|nr:flagellar hook-length control protein FliK [Paenibacillus lemnae]NMO96160.1 flagellar hook-length control protein FliK [Paenibacillus lemnae]